MNIKTYLTIFGILILLTLITVFLKNRSNQDYKNSQRLEQQPQSLENASKEGVGDMKNVNRKEIPIEKVINKEISLVDWKTKRLVALTHDLTLNVDGKGKFEIYERKTTGERDLYYSAVIDPFMAVNYRFNSQTASEFLNAKVLAVASDDSRKAILLEFDLVGGDIPTKPLHFIFKGNDEGYAKRRVHYLFITGDEMQSLSIFPETIWWSITGLEPVGISLELANSCALFYKNPTNKEIVRKDLFYHPENSVLTTYDSNRQEVHSANSEWWSGFQFWDLRPFNQLHERGMAPNNQMENAKRHGFKVESNTRL